MRALRLITLGSLVLLSACDACDDRPSFCPGCSDTDTDTDADTDTDTDADADTDADTDADVDFEGFREPGDIGVFDDPGTDDLQVDLSDLDGESNRGQEFYAIFVNSGSSATGYETWYTVTEESSVVPAAQPVATESPSGPSEFRRQLRAWKAEREAAGVQAPPPPPPPDLVVGESVDTFRVRNDLNDERSYDLTSATLVALGETVAIWVDDDVNIDWDHGCDGTIDAYDPDGNSFGFDNCDLETIAGIVDSNIMVNLAALLGDFSDVNGDSRVTVLVTPVLNRLPQTSSDPDARASVLESYADPEVDLTEYDADSNPLSDYQEIIYVFAPDPYGYFNEDFTTTVEAYTSMSLAAQIAAETTHLIVYNQKVLALDGEDEDTWLMQGLAAVAADTCGFGAIFFDDAWNFLDATHLSGLTNVSSESGLSLEGRGAQYLFLRWLVDVYGSDILAELVQSAETGTDNVASAVQALGGSDNFDEIVMQWYVALLTSGMTNADGDPLMDSGDWPGYGAAEFIEAPTEPPETPSVGTYYGANGYQRGVNFRGANVYMEGGTTADPYENTDLRVTLGNADHFTWVPGFDFVGHMSGGYGASVVRLADIPYAKTTLNILPAGGGIETAVIRWNDPTGDDISVEQIYSSSVTYPVTLPSLPDDGTPIYGIGAIGGAWQIATYDPEGLYADADFYDTDRWTIDLTDRALGSSVRMNIWLDRQYESTGGDAAPYDPWFAVVPVDYVPTPDEAVTTRAMCSHVDGIPFAYPTSVLQYLFYQEVLSHTPISEAVLETQQGDDDEGSTGFDPCGVPAPDTGLEPDCSNDWDLDAVLDADEPVPTTFYQQVLTKMCSIHPDLPDSGAWGTGWFDVDTLDKNQSSTVNRVLNTGGRADESGEEAFLDITLEGGQEYLLVVGGGTDQGVYELTLQEIPG